MLHYLTIYVETFITLQLCLRGVAQLVESHCYWPDSTDASTGSDTYVPCFVNASTSVCCLRGDLCLTTGLCFTPDLGQVYRATCTDRLWKNKTACPDLCGSVLPRNRAYLFTCGPNAQGEWKWWCGNTYEAVAPCTTGDNVSFFDWESAGFGGFAGAEKDQATAIVTSTSFVANPTADAPMSCPPPAATQTGNNRNKVIGIAISLGIGIPLLALVGIGGLVLFRHQRKQRIAAGADKSQELHQAKRLINDLYADVRELDARGQISELDSNATASRGRAEPSNDRKSPK